MDGLDNLIYNEMAYQGSAYDKFKNEMKDKSISEIVVSLFEKHSDNGRLIKSKEYRRDLEYGKHLIKYERLPLLRKSVDSFVHWLKNNVYQTLELERTKFADNNLDKLNFIWEEFADYIKRNANNYDSFMKLYEMMNNERIGNYTAQIEFMKKTEIALTFNGYVRKAKMPRCIFIKEMKNPERFGDKIARKYIKHINAQKGEVLEDSRDLDELLDDSYLKINDLIAVEVVYPNENVELCERLIGKVMKSDYFKKKNLRNFFKEPKNGFDGSIKCTLQTSPEKDYTNLNKGQKDFYELQITDVKHLIESELGERSHASIYKTRQEKFYSELNKKEKLIYDGIKEIAKEITTPYWEMAHIGRA
ncbi:MAG: hypothetical protein PWR30_563 [Candidatus Woesearchaeota archaeon]|nr:hypothetical protein [Candidatus Woesearchaeota archaeon]